MRGRVAVTLEDYASLIRLLYGSAHDLRFQSMSARLFAPSQDACGKRPRNPIIAAIVRRTERGIGELLSRLIPGAQRVRAGRS
jgi:hypothetical protein